MQTSILKNKLKGSAAVMALATCLVAASPTQASDDKHNFNIKLNDLASSLLQISEQSGTQIFFSPEALKGKVATDLLGSLTVRQALDQLLSGTDLGYVLGDGNTIVIRKTSARSASFSGALDRIGTTSAAEYEANLGVYEGDERTDEVDAFELDEIIVTAQKRAQSLKDVPISIVAMGAAELEERGIENFEDLGLAVPGLAIQDGGGDTTGRRIYIRGVGNNIGSSSLVGIYLDEAPLTTNPFYQLDVRPYDLERVEVLRGPQGTLYGQGSSGGTIRFITKNPDTDTFAVKTDVMAEFTKGGGASQRVEAMVNVPLVEDKLAIRVAGIFDHDGGWIDQPTAQQKNINDRNTTNVRFKALWRPTEEFEVTAMANIHRKNAGAPSIGEDGDGNFEQAFGLLTTPSSEDRYEIYNLIASYDFANVNLLSSTSYVDVEKWSFGGSLKLELSPLFPMFHSLDDFNNIKTEAFTQEVRLASSGDGPLQWTVGGIYQDTNSFRRNRFAGGFFAGPGIIPPFDVSTTDEGSESWAVFGNSSYKLSSKIELGIGLRYFEDSREFFNGIFAQKAKFDSLSPRFYANFHVADEVMLYASVAKGFRSGGFDSRFARSVLPETLWTYEAGIKADLFEGMVSSEVSLFFSEYKDFQIVTLDPTVGGLGAGVLDNAGDAEIKGIDWSLTLRPISQLSFVVNGTYIDHGFVAIDGTAPSFAVGDRLEFVPDYQVTATANYDFEWKDRPGYLRVDYNRKGKSYFGSQVLDDPLAGVSEVVDMLNVSIGWQWNDQLSLGVFAKNLLNDRHFLDPFVPLEFAARSRPRTIGVKLGFEF